MLQREDKVQPLRKFQGGRHLALRYWRVAPTGWHEGQDRIAHTHGLVACFTFPADPVAIPHTTICSVAEEELKRGQ